MSGFAKLVQSRSSFPKLFQAGPMQSVSLKKEEEILRPFPTRLIYVVSLLIFQSAISLSRLIWI